LTSQLTVVMSPPVYFVYCCSPCISLKHEIAEKLLFTVSSCISII